MTSTTPDPAVSKPARERTIPFDADLLFVESLASGTVHIAVRYQPHHLDEDAVTEVIDGGSAFVAMAIAPTVTRCGKRTFPQFERDHVKTVSFSDDQLCRACYRTLTAQDQERAFEHAQPGDEDDLEEAA